MKYVEVEIPQIVDGLTGSVVFNVQDGNVEALQRGQASHLMVGSEVVIIDEYQADRVAYCNVFQVTEDGTLRSIYEEMSAAIEDRG